MKPFLPFTRPMIDAESIAAVAENPIADSRIHIPPGFGLLR